MREAEKIQVEKFRDAVLVALDNRIASLRGLLESASSAEHGNLCFAVNELLCVHANIRFLSTKLLWESDK